MNNSINSDLTKIQQLVNLNKMQEAEIALLKLTQSYPKQGRLADYYLHHLMMTHKEQQAINFLENLDSVETISQFSNNDLVNILQKGVFLFCFNPSNKLAQEIVNRKAHSHDKRILLALIQFNIEFRDYEKAINLIEEASEDCFNSSDIQQELIRCYIATGKFALAEANIQACLKQGKVTNAILIQMLSLPYFKNQQDLISNVIAKLQTSSNPNNATHSLTASSYYALAKYYKTLNRSSDAWRYAQIANNLGRPEQKFDLAIFKNGIETIKQIYQRRDKYSTSPETKATPQIILIVGMPRSGTTLLEQNILKLTQCYSGGETLASEAAYAAGVTTNPKGEVVDFNAEKFRQAYLNYITQFVDFNHDLIIDKVPTNYLYLGLFKLAFPNVKIINMKRKIADNILSIFFESFHPRFNYTFALSDIKLVYRQYEDIMRYWHLEFSANIFDLNYESYVCQNDDINQKIKAFLDLKTIDFDKSSSENPEKTIIETPNVWRARQPITAKLLDSWHPYYEHLNDLGL